MRPLLIVIHLTCLLSTTFCSAQKHHGELARAEFNCSANKLGFFEWMFDTKKEFLDFVDIKKGDVAAEIGAGDGVNIGILSLLTDSVTFYAEDIDAKSLTQKHLNKSIHRYEKIKGTKQTNRFQLVLGTISASKLPDTLFDKILIIDSYHDFDNKDDMLEDISRKLKTNGQLLILDGFSFVGDTQTCYASGRHVISTLDVELKRFAKHGFYLNKIRSPDCYAIHYGNALVFEKDKNKSDAFYRLKNEIDPLVLQSFRFKIKDVASDQKAMRTLADSLLTRIQVISSVYKEYEAWVKDIALWHLGRSNFQAAINICTANTRFYPNSYQAFYWLGLAYQEDKQYALAWQNFKISLSLKPDNIACIQKIQTVEKLN
jgi:ubiquinone/menaquinone biosynthesis C-methylase UbiE